MMKFRLPAVGEGSKLKFVDRSVKLSLLKFGPEDFYGTVNHMVMLCLACELIKRNGKCASNGRNRFIWKPFLQKRHVFPLCFFFYYFNCLCVRNKKIIKKKKGNWKMCLFCRTGFQINRND